MMHRQRKKRALKKQGFKKNLGAFLSIEKRKLIIEMQSIPAFRRRLNFINYKLKTLGAFKGKGTWQNPTAIKFYYAQRKTVVNRLAQLKPFANSNLVYNCAPQYVAKALGTTPTVIYRLLAIFARTGDIKFSRDSRTFQTAQADSISIAGKKHGRNTTEKAPATEMQNACIGLPPCPASIGEIKIKMSPRQKSWNSCNQFDTDYFRTEIAEDIPSINVSKSSHTRFYTLLKRSYKANVLAGKIIV